MKRTLEDISIAILANVLRFAVAATFIFSGVVKLIDPHGTEYKIEDYAAAFHLSGLLPALLPLLLSVLVSVMNSPSACSCSLAYACAPRLAS